MKTIIALVLALASFSVAAQNITVTLTFTPAQAGVLSNAVAAANDAATDAYTALLADRLAENARLLAANPLAATNALPVAPVALTLTTYVEGFAVSALGGTQARVDNDLATDLIDRIRKLNHAELRALRPLVPKRR